MRIYPSTYAVYLRGRMVAVVSYLQGKLLSVNITIHGEGDIAETMVHLPSKEVNISRIEALTFIPVDDITMTT